MKKGRPVTKTGPAAAKSRAASKKSYAKMTPAERTSLVQGRDKEAQRAGDARRLAKARPARNEYHKKQAQAVKGVPSGGKCSACGSTTNVERHHIGGKVVKLCGKCHGKRS
jgi:hypothetical protein